MNLTLHNLMPIPLRETLMQKGSDLWQQNLSIEQGDYVLIQAPSGTGKSTLIHSLYGIRKDYEGKILWDNQSMSEIDEESLAQLRAQKLSIVFQDLRLFPELTAIENLLIKASLTESTDKKTIEYWMELLGIGHKKNSKAGLLSYGEQQRLAIIRALLQPFSFLLMDEPFSHLDEQNIHKAAALIVQVAQQNNAAIISAELEANQYFPYHKTLHL